MASGCQAESYLNTFGGNAPGSCGIERANARVDSAVSSPLRTFERNAELCYAETAAFKQSGTACKASLQRKLQGRFFSIDRDLPGEEGITYV